MRSILYKLTINMLVPSISTILAIIQLPILKLLRSFKIGSCMIARIVDIEGTNILIDITISISNEVKDIILKDIM
ncbi:hypothetical protein ACTPEX_16740, partial [Clostridioides difficile]